MTPTDSQLPADIAEAQSVCAAAAAGDLEARILRIDPDSNAADLLYAINHLLDMTDAFVREATASLDAASSGQFFRRVLPAGMLGSFGIAARGINAATENMAKQATDLEAAEAQRVALEDDFCRARDAAAKLTLAIDQILDMSNTIGSIASQTNLLALNASIEAARVGQSGAGFAVVANEVKQLAQRSHQATSRIQSDIAEVRSAAEETSRTIEHVWTVIQAQVNDQEDPPAKAAA